MQLLVSVHNCVEMTVPLISFTQNENGPCPLLAICNVLILRGAMKILPGNSNVSSTYLLDLLGTYLLEQNRTQELSEGEKANLERNILDTMTIFPRLPTGLDVNVHFDRSVRRWGSETSFIGTLSSKHTYVAAVVEYSYALASHCTKSDSFVFSKQS